MVLNALVDSFLPQKVLHYAIQV